MQINLQKRVNFVIQQIDYTRIEPIPGGAARLAMPKLFRLNGKVTDGKRRINVLI